MSSKESGKTPYLRRTSAGVEGLEPSQAKPLTFPSPKGLSSLRAHVWLASVMVRAGIQSPTRLEREIRRHFRDDPENSGNLRLFAQARALPFRAGERARIWNAVWPDKAQQIWPGTIDWLVTPFWYLLEHAPDVSALTECVLTLPESFQEELLVDVEAGLRSEFTFLARSCVHELTVPLGPFALGALACGMRRARLAGDMAAERWCAVALVWCLQALLIESDRMLRPLLTHLLDAYLLHAAEHVYPNGMHAAITSEEVERFARERDAFVRWTVEDQIAAGSEPSWLEKEQETAVRVS
jgi:hypothetical protein